MPRPHKAILSRELIFRAALDMLDKTGRFTVPARTIAVFQR